MNDPVAQMKQDVGQLMQGNESNEGNADDGNANDSTDIGGVDSDASSNVNDSDGENVSPQLSERDQIELEKALSSGWKKEEEWKGDPSDFIRPREWNRTVALLRKIDREGAERRRLEKEVGSFGDRLKNVMEVAKATAITELEAKKKEAVESADYEEVRRIDSEIDKTNDGYKVDTPEPQQSIRPEVEDWMSENQWFEKDKEMTNFALSFQYSQLSRLSDPSNPSGDELKRALKNTSRALRNEFPDKFKQRPRAVAPSLERGSLKATSKKFGYNDLNEQEKKVLMEIERLGGMSRDDYIQAVADMRGSK